MNAIIEAASNLIPGRPLVLRGKDGRVISMDRPKFIWRCPALGLWYAHYHALALVCLLCPALPVKQLASVFVPYASMLGVGQGWEFFAPNPGTLDGHFLVRINYSSGGSYEVQVPPKSDNPFVLFADYRLAKWTDNALSKPYYYPKLCAYTACRYPGCLSVDLFTETRTLTGPGTDQAWSARQVWHYAVKTR